MMSTNLNPGKALIFRITHRDNLPWVLDHGLYARNGGVSDPTFRNIGNLDLIDKRSRRTVPVPPGGTLSDYVPFYFTPFSIMMYNIKTGYGGVKRVPNDEIIIFVSSLHHVAAQGLHDPAGLRDELGLVFKERKNRDLHRGDAGVETHHRPRIANPHAYPQMAEYFTDLAQLDRIDWPLLQSRDFKHDPDDPGKKERYQAEALIWGHLPLDALLGVCCCTEELGSLVRAQLNERRLGLKSSVQPKWYFQ